MGRTTWIVAAGLVLVLSLVGLVALGASEPESAPREASDEVAAAEARADGADPAPDGSTSAGASAPAATTAAHDAAPDAAPATGAADGARRSAVAAVELRARATGGGALADCAVTWSPLDGAPADELDDEGWRALLESSVRGVTDGAGRWTRDEVPAFARAARSVLWVSAPGHAAAYRLLEPVRAAAGPLALEVELAPAAATRARVVGPDGVGLAGAEVLLTGLSLEGLRRLDPLHPGARASAEEDPELERVLTVLVRVAESGPGGELELPASPRPARAVARAGLLVSPPGITGDAERLELQLDGEATVSGRLTLLEDIAVPAGPDVFVDVWHLQGDRRTLLGSAEVLGSGAFGPLRVPARATGRYRFEVRCLVSSIQAAWRELPCRGPGETLRVTLDGSLTRPQEVRVVDLEGEPVEGARVVMSWTHARGEQSLEAFTDAEGTAWLRNPPGDYCNFTATGPGFAAARDLLKYAPWPDPRVLTLAPGGRVRARVVHAGEPVRRFRLHAWVEGDPIPRVLTPRLAPDGSFLLDDLPLEEVRLRAAGVEFGASEVVTVRPARDGEPPEVTLALATGVVGHGVVLDAASGRPVAGAEVLVEDRLALDGTGRERAVGTRPLGAVTGADGRFELGGLPAGRATLVVRAHGYAAARIEEEPGADGRTDCGAIQLVPPQDLLVRYTGEEPFDPMVHWLRGLGPVKFPMQLFDAEGRATIAELSPGPYELHVVEQDTLTLKRTVELRPGEAWEVDFDHLPSRTLDVLVRTGEGASLPPAAAVVLTTHTSGGAPLQIQKQVSPDGLCGLRHVVDGQVVVTVVDLASGEVLASRPAAVGADRGEPIVIVLGRRDLRVLARTPDGEPVTAGRALVVANGEATPWTTLSGFDEEGVALLRGIPSDRARLSVVHPGLGVALTEVELDGEEITEVRLTVGDGHPLEVRVVDDDGPVDGVRLGFHPLDLVTAPDALTSGRTDALGSYRHPGLPRAGLRLTAERPGYWPHQEELEVTGQPAHEVRLRRPGELAVGAYGPGGFPAPGARLVLRSVQYGSTVDAWIEAGRLPAHRARLVADAAGRCEVLGLPCGPYDWELVLPDGARATGRLEVRETAHAPIALTVGG